MSVSKIYVSKAGTCYAVRPEPKSDRWLICYQSKRVSRSGIWWASSSSGPFDSFEAAHAELDRLAKNNGWHLMDVEIGAAIRWLP